MTRGEAINIISQMIKDEEGFLSDNTVEAHKMAIQALSQEPCEDAVSRQAALNSLIDNTHLDGYDLAEALDAIENKEKLPPVTPQPKTGRWIYEKRKRLIDETDEGAEYITDYWCKCSNCDGDFGYRKMKDAFCKYCGAKMIEPQESEDKG